MCARAGPTVISNGASGKTQHDKFRNCPTQEGLLIQRRQFVKLGNVKLGPGEEGAYSNPQRV